MQQNLKRENEELKKQNEELNKLEASTSDASLTDEEQKEINSNMQVENTVERSIHINPLSAGAAGYFHIMYNRPEGWEDATVSSYEVRTSSVSNTQGLQLTIISVGISDIYINYYAPKTMPLAVDGYVRVTLRRNFNV